MKNATKLSFSKIGIPAIAVTLVIVMASIFSYFLGFRNVSNTHRNTKWIEKGILDLSTNNFEKTPLILLKGEVEFFWNQLLSPEEPLRALEKPEMYINIPGTWNSSIVQNKAIGGFGYATYKFRIIVPSNQLYALTIREFDCAYKIWINGEAHEIGKVGRSKKEMKPSWKRQTLFFHPDEKNEISVVLQISNFQHRKGGAEDPMIFGKANAVYYYKLTQIGTTLFLLGSLLMMSIYHLLLYVHRKKETSLILFSLICIMMALRLATTGEKVLLEIWPGIPWLFAVKLEYLSYKIVAPLLVSFFYTLFPNEVSKLAVKISVVFAVSFSLIVIFTSAFIFSHTPVVYQIFIILLALYILFALFKATLHKRPQALVFFAGYLFFMVVMFNDVFYYNNVIDTGFLMPLGLFVLIFSQASALSLKSSQALQTIEAYKIELEQNNLQLENKVLERTAKIENQKNEIETQAVILQETNNKLQELSKFKNDMTSMIVHDLKNPLNIILNFAKNEHIIYAANQMLNLVHNILDLQRKEDSELTIDLNETSLNHILNAAFNQTKYLLEEKNIQIVNKSACSIHLKVDIELMIRVLVNLLTNAIKFSPNNSVISIGCIEVDDRFMLTFTDHGSGIAPEMRPKIFEKFGQAVKRRIGKSESTGIGLAFCKMVVEAHGGAIGYESFDGNGSTFWINMKRITASDINTTTNEKLVIPISKTSNIELDASAKAILSKFANSLNALKVYEVSKIQGLIHEIETEPGLADWIKKLNDIVWKGNQKAYNDFIKNSLS